MRRLTITVPETAAGRVDRFVADVSGLSRTYVQKLISEGRLTVGGIVVKANVVVVPGEIVELDVPDPKPLELEAEPIPLSIVYEDDDLLIVDKAAGLVVHPAAGHKSGTLVNALLARDTEYGGIAGVQRPGIVHRLDRDTSGLLMVAKNDRSQASLMAQLKARSVKKTYLGLAMGAVAASLGRIEAPIGRDPHHRTRMAVVPDGREAVTGYHVRERFAGWTLLELDLITGRTHQIRVHLAAIDHPLAGDPWYGTGTSRRGPDGLERLFLHSWRIELQSPADGHLIRATAPLPVELEAVLEGLRGQESGRPGPKRVAQTPDGLGGGDVSRRPDSGSRDAAAHSSTPIDAPAPMLVIISGPSGVGKDTIIDALQRRDHRPGYHYVVTCTTRAPRANEIDGVSYSFMSVAQFMALRDAGELLEANEVHGNWYGTPRAGVREALARGQHAILKIDVQGAQVVKGCVPGALLIFVVPPSLETLFQHLKARQTESADELEIRQRNAAIELARADDYDYVVVNEENHVDLTAERIEEIIAIEERRGPRRVVTV